MSIGQSLTLVYLCQTIKMQHTLKHWFKDLKVLPWLLQLLEKLQRCVECHCQLAVAWWIQLDWTPAMVRFSIKTQSDARTRDYPSECTKYFSKYQISCYPSVAIEYYQLGAVSTFSKLYMYLPESLDHSGMALKSTVQADCFEWTSGWLFQWIHVFLSATQACLLDVHYPVS